MDRPRNHGSVVNAHEQRVADRVARMRARATRLAAEAESARAGLQPLLNCMNGTPVLVGHHSERRHRRDLARIDNTMRKSFEADTEAKDLARRADAAETSTVVSSDDPDAIVKLRAKLAEAEAMHARLLDANKMLRAVVCAADIDRHMRWPGGRTAIWLSMGHKTVPTANSSADIRRIKERISGLEKKAAAPAKAPEIVGDVEIREEENRVRIVFPGKPDETMRSKLKAAGFLWSPHAGAWQRRATESAWCSARKVVTQ